VSEGTRLLEGLRRQREKYLEIAQVSGEQNRLVAAGDVDAILALVERKRALLAEVEAVDRELAPVRGRWEELRATLDPATRAEIESAVEETKRILQDLVRAEDEGRAALEARRQTTADELKDLMKKKRARGAYGGPPGGDPRFLDDAK
jgi:flagellar biosynthesis/type III secretory pathway chaperone